MLGTVDNRGNTEITETVIFVNAVNAVNLPKCRSFTSSQEYFVFNQHNLKFIV